jgi:hypothetical protein
VFSGADPKRFDRRAGKKLRRDALAMLMCQSRKAESELIGFMRLKEQALRRARGIRPLPGSHRRNARLQGE